MSRRRYIIGIDEVGRGSLAGPVVVAAVLLPTNFKTSLKGIRDSKKLSKKSREDWNRSIKNNQDILVATSKIDSKIIDAMNISQAANLAALRSFNKLILKNNIDPRDCEVCLDGGLYLGNGQNRLALGKTIIKGDEKIPAISMASIVAKVWRDSIMTRYAKEFPNYSFELNKGYGTSAHLTALSRIGPSRIHRLTFLKGWNNISLKKSNGRRTNKTSYSR